VGLERPAVVGLLEPQDGRAEDAALLHVVARPRLDRAEVLADDDGARAVRLEHQDPEHRLVVVADVGALVGRHPLRHPPEPEEPDDVVDPHRAGVAQDRAHQVAQGGVAQAREGVGTPRRLRPVLALLVEPVRRRADRHALGKHVRHGPDVGSVRVHAHREVVHDADPHTGSPRRSLGALELLVHDPLQPAVEVHALGEFGAQPGHERGGAVLGLLGPFLTRVVLGEGAPQREVLEPLALVGSEPVERAPAGPAARRREDHLEGGLLGLPDGVAVDRAGVAVGGPDLFRGPLDQGALLGG